MKQAICGHSQPTIQASDYTICPNLINLVTTSLISTCQSIRSPFPHPNAPRTPAIASRTRPSLRLCSPSSRRLATMTISIDKIVDGFPHPNIAPIVELNLQLNANAASVQSNLGDGQLGLLALTVSPAVSTLLAPSPSCTPLIPERIPSSLLELHM